jgi:hypothetical protein
MSRETKLTKAGLRPSKSRVVVLSMTSLALAGVATAAFAALTASNWNIVSGWANSPTGSNLVLLPVATASLLVSSSTMTTTAAAGDVVQPKSPAPTPGVRPMTLGVNLGAPYYYATQRTFSNLLAGSDWSLFNTKTGWAKMPADRLTEDGVVKSLASGEAAVRTLNVPPAVLRGASMEIKCTWQGTGSVELFYPDLTMKRVGKSLTFMMKPKAWEPLAVPVGQKVRVTATDIADPIRKIDCRESSASPTALYDPAFLKSLAPFTAIRFMDWMGVNLNKPVTWAGRTRGSSDLYFGPTDGPSVEHMVTLANTAAKDPWFNMPWNADDEYYRQFAIYVRDNLAPGRKAYIEVSNEVWNWGFPVAVQAADEGVAKGFSANRGKAQMMRYSEKIQQVLKIWTEVFAGQEDRLVRVAATQAANSATTEIVLAFPGTAQYVDAVAIAPYFIGGDLVAQGATLTNLDTWFDTAVQPVMEQVFTWVEQNNAVIKKYNKRMICYETGQHFKAQNNVPLLAKVNRHPKIGTFYTQFLKRWQGKYGDTVMFYNDVSQTNMWGAWGLLEYQGQPLTQAPKMKAVVDYAATL